MKRGPRAFLFVLVCTVILLALACAGPKMHVTYMRPAEINLKGITTVSVVEFSGKGGQDFHDELESALTQSYRFDVVDRAHLNDLMREKGFSVSDHIDESTATEIGKMLGAAALIFGRVSEYDYSEKVDKRTYKDKKGKAHTQYTRIGDFAVTANIQVTDLTTGKILTKAPIRHVCRDRTGSVDESPANIDKDGLMSECRQKVIDEFMKKIAPYPVTETVNFKKSKECPELEHGINCALSGDMDGATEIFEKAKNDYPGDAYAHFDYAVACEVQGRYEEATEEYQLAYQLLPKKWILDAKSRCMKRAADEARLREQGL